MSVAKTFVVDPARRLLHQCLDLRPGENLLVIADTSTVPYGEAFAGVGREMGAEVVMVVMDPRGRHGEEPPPQVAAAMRAADAIVAPTTFSVNHSEARLAASKAGARLIFMPDVCDEVFLDGSLDIDFAERKTVIDRVARVLEAGREVRVRSPRGTDLWMSVAGKSAVPQSGICHEPGTISPPPCIECAVAPDEGTTRGVMVIDGATVPGAPVEEPITATFRDGRIVSLEGGEDARYLRELLDGYDDPNMYCPVEMGMGMNPNARIGQGGPLENEAEFGTMHIGIGNGITFGSSIRAPGHCDLVMRDAIIEVDGAVLLADGELHLPD